MINEPSQISCLNSYGCQQKVQPGQIFCSEKCRLIYRGELKPNYTSYTPYIGSNPDFKIISQIFQEFYGCLQKQPKKRGVKTGTKRGEYNKPLLERKAKLQKEQHRRKLQRERVRRHRQQKKLLEQNRKEALIHHV